MTENVMERRPKLISASATFDEPSFRGEILGLVASYLEHEAELPQAADFLRKCLTDEDSVVMPESTSMSFKDEASSCAEEGDFDGLRSLSASIANVSRRDSALYEVFKQEFLELVDNNETPSKAFGFLLKKLKPLERCASSKEEFVSLCFAATAKSVDEAFPSWGGVARSRQNLVSKLVELSARPSFVQTTRLSNEPPKGRLVKLLHQAAAYQIEFSKKFHPKATPVISTLTKDFNADVVPSECSATIDVGDCIKAIQWASANDVQDPTLIIGTHSGNVVLCTAARDNESFEKTAEFSTHKGAAIWGAHCVDELAITCDSRGFIGVTDVTKQSSKKLKTSHSRDVYACALHSQKRHVATAGYDSRVLLTDLDAQKVVREFEGHESAVTCAAFYDDLLVTGGNDSFVRVWDVVSGANIKTWEFSRRISSVAFDASNSSRVLVSSCDGAVRLIDLSTGKTLQRFKGHKNEVSHFVRASFGPCAILSGSEDGTVWAWDSSSGECVQNIRASSEPIYDAKWNPVLAAVATGGKDGLVKLWR